MARRRADQHHRRPISPGQSGARGETRTPTASRPPDPKGCSTWFRYRASTMASFLRPPGGTEEGGEPAAGRLAGRRPGVAGMREVEINGEERCVFEDGDGRAIAVVALNIADDQVHTIHAGQPREAPQLRPLEALSLREPVLVAGQVVTVKYDHALEAPRFCASFSKWARMRHRRPMTEVPPKPYRL